jgi:hypothetical protein
MTQPQIFTIVDGGSGAGHMCAAGGALPPASMVTCEDDGQPRETGSSVLLCLRRVRNVGFPVAHLFRAPIRFPVNQATWLRMLYQASCQLPYPALDALSGFLLIRSPDIGPAIFHFAPVSRT